VIDGKDLSKVAYDEVAPGTSAGGLRSGGEGRKGEGDERPKGQGRAVERVMNVMGSCAGAGSGDFHTYRHTRRTELTRLERIEQSAKEEELDAEFDRRVAEKRRECEERTKRNAEKRRRKKDRAKLRESAPPPPVANDGSFLAKALAAAAAAEADESRSTCKIP